MKPISALRANDSPMVSVQQSSERDMSSPSAPGAVRIPEPRQGFLISDNPANNDRGEVQGRAGRRRWRDLPRQLLCFLQTNFCLKQINSICILMRITN